MACMGPDKDFAVIRANDVHAEVMQLLKDKYNVTRPVNIMENGFGKRMQDDFDQHTDELLKALIEVVWDSDAANW